MHHIIYMSSAVTLFSDNALKDLLSKARKYNLQINITGILLYKDGNFLQAIEGDKNNVEALFKKNRKKPVA
ncbi:MAG: hypothetical protein ACJA08_002288 [Cyclobacteriaceae bacterium]|jgi:hypothetical protein